MVSAQEVQFQPKAPDQKNDCPFCIHVATQEAVYGVSRIRCCTNESCMRRATTLALLPYKETSLKLRPMLVKN